MVVEDGRIKEITSHGDYFGNGSFEDIRKRLTGCELKVEVVLSALEGLEIGNYYNNLKKEDFVDLIVL